MRACRLSASTPHAPSLFFAPLLPRVQVPKVLRTPVTGLIGEPSEGCTNGGQGGCVRQGANEIVRLQFALLAQMQRTN